MAREWRWNHPHTPETATQFGSITTTKACINRTLGLGSIHVTRSIMQQSFQLYTLSQLPHCPLLPFSPEQIPQSRHLPQNAEKSAVAGYTLDSQIYWPFWTGQKHSEFRGSHWTQFHRLPKSITGKREVRHDTRKATGQFPNSSPSWE